MPVVKKGSKYAIGTGKAIYKTKAAAERAYKGYMAHKHMEEEGRSSRSRKR